MLELNSPSHRGLPLENGPERLQEPHLSYYLAVREQFAALQLQAAALAQAVQAVTQVVSRFYATGPQDGIDAQGYIHRAPEAGEEP